MASEVLLKIVKKAEAFEKNPSADNHYRGLAVLNMARRAIIQESRAETRAVHLLRMVRADVGFTYLPLELRIEIEKVIRPGKSK